MKSTLSIYWEDWCWSWNSNTLAICWEEPTHWKRPRCLERLRAGGEEPTEDEMVGWHHWLNGHEFKQTPGDSEGQGSLECCSPRGGKELDTLSRWTSKWTNCTFDSICILKFPVNTCWTELIDSLFIPTISCLSNTSQALADRQLNGGKKNVLLKTVRCVTVKCQSLVWSDLMMSETEERAFQPWDGHEALPGWGEVWVGPQIQFRGRYSQGICRMACVEAEREKAWQHLRVCVGR